MWLKWASINLHLFLTQNDHMTAADVEYSAQVVLFYGALMVLGDFNIHCDNTEYRSSDISVLWCLQRT